MTSHDLLIFCIIWYNKYPVVLLALNPFTSFFSACTSTESVYLNTCRRHFFNPLLWVVLVFQIEQCLLIRESASYGNTEEGVILYSSIN